MTLTEELINTKAKDNAMTLITRLMTETVANKQGDTVINAKTIEYLILCLNAVSSANEKMEVIPEEKKEELEKLDRIREQTRIRVRRYRDKKGAVREKLEDALNIL